MRSCDNNNVHILCQECLVNVYMDECVEEFDFFDLSGSKDQTSRYQSSLIRNVPFLSSLHVDGVEKLLVWQGGRHPISPSLVIYDPSLDTSAKSASEQFQYSACPINHKPKWICWPRATPYFLIRGDAPVLPTYRKITPSTS